MFRSGAAGTASNDALSLYALATIGAAGLYVASHGRKIAAEYNQAHASAQKPGPVRPVAQLGLLYNTSHSSDRASFNSTSETEKESREAAVFNLMRTIHKQHDQKRLPLNFKTTIVSRAGSSTTKVEGGSKDLNSECADTSDQTAWWKARYEATPLVETGKTHLPMTFYMEATDFTGKHIVHYGLVKRLVMEVDQNIMAESGSPVQGVSYKLYMTLVDTNWLNPGGLPGKNSEISIVVSQQSSRCAFSAVVKGGKTYNVFVSSLAFSLHPSVLRLVDPIKPFYESTGMVLTSDEYYKVSTPGTLARVNFHGSSDRLLSFIFRALPLVDPSVVWSRGANNSVRIGGETARSLLPLQVHVRSGEKLNDAGDKYLAINVREIALRSSAESLPPGDLRTDPSFIKAVSFKLENNTVLSQDTNDRVSWYVDGKKLEGSPTIDLVVLSRAPDATTFRLSHEIAAVTNGARKFTSFESPMFGNQQISLNKEVYNQARATNPSKADGDLVTAGGAEKELPAPIQRESWILVAAVTIVFLAGWKFASQGLAGSVARLARFFCFAGALGAVGLAIAEYRDWTSVMGYDSIVLGVVFTCCTSALLASLLIVRLSPDLAPCIGVGVSCAMVSAVLLYYLSVPREGSVPGPGLAAVRVAFLVVLSQSLGLLVLEMGKLVKKMETLETQQPPPVSLSLPSIPLVVFIAVCVLGTLSFGYVGAVARAPDQCLVYQEEVERLSRIHPPAESVGAVTNAIEHDAAMMRLAACNEHRLSIPAVLSRTWWLPLIALVCFVMVLQVIGNVAATTLVRSTIPSSVAPSRSFEIEDGRVPRGTWLFKTLVGAVLLYIILTLIHPSVEIYTPVCNQAREAYTREQKSASEERTTLLDSEMDRMGCTADEVVATRSAIALLMAAMMASFVVPVTQKLVYHRASAPQALSLFIYTCFVGIAGMWALDPRTKDYFVEKNLTR